MSSSSSSRSSSSSSNHRQGSALLSGGIGGPHEAGQQQQQQQQRHQAQPVIARLRTTPAFAAIANRLTSVSEAAAMLQRMLHLGDAAASEAEADYDAPSPGPDSETRLISELSGQSSSSCVASCPSEELGPGPCSSDGDHGTHRSCPSDSLMDRISQSGGRSPSSERLPELSPSTGMPAYL